MKIKIIGLLIILVIISIFVWKTEWFKKTVHPNDYWTERVNKIEHHIWVDKLLIRDSEIDLEILIATTEYEIKRALIYAELDDSYTEDEAIQETKDGINLEKDYLKDEIEMMKQGIIGKEKKLELAKQKKAECQ